MNYCNCMNLKFLIILTAFFIGNSAMAQKKPNPVPETLSEVLDINYAKYDERSVQLDLYALKTPAIRPGIVLIHGGASVSLEREKVGQAQI